MSFLASTTSRLVLLQIISKLATFIPNQFIIRIVPPHLYGTAAIQFELLLSTILFLSREGVRNASLRSENDSKHRSEQEQNVALLPILAGTPITILVSALYFFTSTSSRQQPHFLLSVSVISLSALIELLTEPFFIRAQTTLRINARVRAEGIAILAKSLVSLVVMLLGSNLSLLAFALGQLGYSIALMLVYWNEFGETSRHALELKLTTSKGEPVKPLFDPEMSKLSFAMTRQSLVKHALTEGDKFLVSRISPLESQGAYALAANYGSLIARIIFQPIEESSRLYFSKTLAPVLSTVPGTTHNPPLVNSLQTLAILLLAEVHLGLFLLTFGPPLLPLFLSYALPESYHSTSAPTILHAYLYYLSIMALNGTLEAFLSSISTPKDLAAQSRWMVFFSFLTIVVGWIFAILFKMGDVGLVWANVLNSFVRATYCVIVIRIWFKEKFTLAKNTNLPTNKSAETTSATLNKPESSENSALSGLKGVNLEKTTNPVMEPWIDNAKASDNQLKSPTDFTRELLWSDVTPPNPVCIVFGITALLMRLTPNVISYRPGMSLRKDIEFVFVGIVGFVGCALACFKWEWHIICKSKYHTKEKDQ